MADKGSPYFYFSPMDYATTLDMLGDYAAAKYPGELWATFPAGSQNEHMLKELAYSSEVLSYYQNANILETQLPTLVRKSSLLDLAKNYSFKMHKSTASSANSVRVYNLSTRNVDYPFTITKYFTFSSNTGVVFEREADIYVTAGSVSYNTSDGYYIDIELKQGETQTLSLGTSDGRPDQAIVVSDDDVLEGSLLVDVGGEEYVEVTNMYPYGSSDKVYTIEKRADSGYVIRFGNGTHGAIPVLNKEYTITYKKGGGRATNLLAETELSISAGGELPDALVSAKARLMVNAYGGCEPEKIEPAKYRLSLSNKANGMAIYNSDYIAAALSVPGVFAANAVQGTLRGLSPVTVYVVPGGLGTPSASLLSSVQQACLVGKSGKRVVVKSPVYPEMVVEGTAYIGNTASKKKVKQEIANGLLALYGEDATSFGAVQKLQYLYELLDTDNITGLSRIIWSKYSVNPYWGSYPLKPISAAGAVEEILVDWDLVRDHEWFIRILDSDPDNSVYCSRFMVRKRYLGEVSKVWASSIDDDTNFYTLNALKGMYFKPKPYELGDDSRWLVASNDDNTITMSTSGILASVEEGDIYAVEGDELTYGKILRTATRSAVEGTDTISLDIDTYPTAEYSLVSGDKVVFRDTTHVSQKAYISSILKYEEKLVDGNMSAADTSAWTVGKGSQEKVTVTGPDYLVWTQALRLHTDYKMEASYSVSIGSVCKTSISKNGQVIVTTGLAGGGKISVDGGATWEDIAEAVSDSSVYDNAVNYDGSVYALCGSDRAYIIKTIDTGSYVANVKYGTYKTVSISNSGQHIVLAGPACGIIYSNNYGATFTEAYSPLDIEYIPADDTEYVCSTISDDGKYMFVAANTSGGGNGKLYGSWDYGETWYEYKPMGDTGVDWASIVITGDASVLVATPEKGKVYKSLDWGATWNPIESIGYSFRSSISTDDTGNNWLISNYNAVGNPTNDVYISFDKLETVERIETLPVGEHMGVALSRDGATAVIGSNSGILIYKGLPTDGGSDPYTSQSVATDTYTYKVTGYYRSSSTDYALKLMNSDGEQIWLDETPSTDWQSFDVEYQANGATIHFGVVGVGSGHIDLYNLSMKQLPKLILDRTVTVDAGATIDHVWESDDGSLEFSVVNSGSTVPGSQFQAGDELYVDTFGRYGDIKSRDETFMTLNSRNIYINVVGGVE